MKKTLFGVIAILTLSSFLFFTSCKKESNIDSETVEAVIDLDNATTEGIVLAQENTSETKALMETSGCMTITRTIDLDSMKGTLVIEFNGDCEDGIPRSGKMIIVWDLGWRLRPDGKGLTITYENFTRGRRIFNGTISYTADVVVDTTNADSLAVVLTANMTNFSITFPDSTTFTISGTRTIEYVSGFFTFWDKSDDILKINANLEGTNRNGEHFVSVSNDLIIKRDCNYFFPVSGTKTISFDDGRTYLIDFGDGTCDRIYTVTVDGQTQTFEFDPTED